MQRQWVWKSNNKNCCVVKIFKFKNIEKTQFKMFKAFSSQPNLVFKVLCHMHALDPSLGALFLLQIHYYAMVNYWIQNYINHRFQKYHFLFGFKHNKYTCSARWLNRENFLETITSTGHQHFKLVIHCPQTTAEWNN